MAQRSTPETAATIGSAEVDMLAQRWGVGSLALQLAPVCAGVRVEVLAEAGSTNTLLLERARRGETAPCVLVAERQTAGRGRHGRQWVSHVRQPAAAERSVAAPATGGSLTVSFGRVMQPRQPRTWSGLSLAVGVALADALHPQVRLKWPNDLWLGADAPSRPGRKLGGVLIETVSAPAPDGTASARYAVIGIGLNVVAPPCQPDWPQSAAGWSELDPAATPASLLARVAAPVLQALAAFEDDGFAPWVGRFAARDLLAGRTVRVEGAGGEAIEGMAEGVDADGSLLLRTPAGVQRVTSGDVSLSQTAPSVRLRG